MKKAFFVSICVVSMIFCSCGNKNSDSSDNNSSGDKDSFSDSDFADSDSSEEDDSPVNDDFDVVPEDNDNPSEYGFSYRKIESKSFHCKNDFREEDIDFSYGDHLCTFEYGGVSGYIYFQATPNACVDSGMSFTPNYETTGWISINGALSGLEKPEYSWGGNHHNDSFTFTYKNQIYYYYHSTFGPGWRYCQPMDCIQILNSDKTVKEDGCTPERNLPIKCVPIKDDGTHDPFPEKFERCEDRVS